VAIKQFTPKSFSAKVLSAAQKTNSVYDALLHVQNEENLEPQTVAALITPALKHLLQAELQNRNMLKRVAKPVVFTE
jgi:hypothetical protein